MLSDELLKLHNDLKTIDPNSDRSFYEIIARSFNILGLPSSEVAKALSVSVEVVENWRQGNKAANFAIRPWIYQYFMKQITLRDQHTTSHISNDYGYKYNFEKVETTNLYRLLLKVAGCSHLLERMQISFNPPKLQFAFFVNNLKGGSFDCIEELHQLIDDLGGKPEIALQKASVVNIPLSKKEKPSPPEKSIIRHCYEIQDGCFIGEGGRCICSCCLLERVEGKPKQITLEVAS